MGGGNCGGSDGYAFGQLWLSSASNTDNTADYDTADDDTSNDDAADYNTADYDTADDDTADGGAGRLGRSHLETIRCLASA
jgi:hypothetical protein